MEHLFIGVFFLVLGLFLIIKLNPINIDPFLREEAERAFKKNNKFERTENCPHNGKVHSEGLSIDERKDGKIGFVRQAKLVDTSIL